MSRRSSYTFRTGSRVEYSLLINGTKRRVLGVIAYGPGSFHLKPNENDWCGVVLDEPVGKNNGTVQGKKYFDCPENCGVFVRSSTLRPFSNLPGLRSTNSPSPASTPNLTPSSSVSSIADLSKDFPSRMSESANYPPSKLPGPSKLKPPSKQTKVSGSSQNVSNFGLSRISSGIPPPSNISSGLSAASSTNSLSGIVPPTKIKEQPQNVKQMIENVEIKVEEKIRELSHSEDISRNVEPNSPSHDNFSRNREIQELNEKNKDLESKLQTLMLKRAEDRAKFKDLERLRIQNEQLAENKKMLQEKIAELTKLKTVAEEQAERAKQELLQQREDMQDLVENSEMAIIDKEITENRVEELQCEVETLKEKLEEAKLDFELLKTEIEKEGVDGAANSFQVKQLEEQNLRLKEALIKIRDISVNDRQNIQELQKELETKTVELSSVFKEFQIKNSDIEKYKESIHELTEQVDLALGSQEMVEKLTEKNLELEDKNEELQKALDEEENLKDLNNMIIEEKDEMIADLRDELDQFKTNFNNLKINYLSTQETINDHENTIRKFRELVSTLKEEITFLRASKEQDKETFQQAVDVQKQLDNIEFKTRLLDRKDFSRTIDMELRQLDVEQCYRYMVYLSKFFPESFFSRGNDNDAIAVLLFFPRIFVKCSIIERQIIEKFNSLGKEPLSNEAIIQQFFSSGIQLDMIDQLQQRIFSKHILYLLCSIRSILDKYQDVIGKCPVELFMKLATLFPELQSCEKDIDHYVELLKQDKLDQSVSLDALEKNLNYLQSLYNIHMSPGGEDSSAIVQKNTTCDGTHNKFINDLLDVLRTAIDASTLDLKILSRIVSSDVGMFLTKIESILNNIDQSSRKIRRRMVSAGSSEINPVCLIRLPLSIEAEILDVLYNLNKALRFLKMIRASLMFQFVQNTVQSKGQEDQSCDVVYFTMEQVNKNCQDLIADDITALNEMLLNIDSIMTKFSITLNQGDFDISKTGSDSESSSLASTSANLSSLSSIQTMFSSSQSIIQNKSSLQTMNCHSLDQRANKWRAQSDQLDEMKVKILNSEAEISNLNRAMKIKLDEVSEMQIRRDIAEKKLSSAQIETKKVLDELERLKKEFKDKEAERERALHKYNQELNELYSDKKLMKEKLKEQSNKNSNNKASLSLPLSNVIGSNNTNNNNITGQQSLVSSMVSLNQSMTSSMLASVEVSELQEQINNLRFALKRMSKRNIELRMKLCDENEFRNEFWYQDNLKRFRSRNGVDDFYLKREAKLNELQNKLLQFKKDFTQTKCSSTIVPNFDKLNKQRTGWTRNLDSIFRQRDCLLSLQQLQINKRYRELQIEIEDFIKSFDDGFVCDSTLTTFIAQHVSKTLDSKSQLLARITAPSNGNQPASIKIPVTFNELSTLCSNLLF